MKWILIIETIFIGIVLFAAIPMWAMVPMFFGVTETSSANDAKPIYVLLILFPIVAIGALIVAWNAAPSSILRPVMMLLPILHIIALFMVRLKP